MRAGTVRGVAARGVATLAVLALAGCAGIPTSGAVQAGDGQVQEPDSVVVIAEGPEPDATPDRIVDGFMLAAVAGLSGALDFKVARQFLASDKAAEWDPLGGVLVASGTRVTRAADTQVTVEASVVGKVDADGRYSEASPDARETVTFDMVQDSRQQWRIADAPDELILTPRQFADQYRAVQLFFLTPGGDYLVPETRHYPVANLATSAVKGLLGGPSPWLRDAVRTEVPRGAQLSPESVPIDAAGTAEVDLAPAGSVLAANRPLMLAQIEATLRQLPQVRDVVVRAGSNGTSLQGAATLATAGAGENTANPVMIRNDRLVELADGWLTPVAGVGSLAGLDARSPASSEDGSLRVLLSGTGQMVLAPSDDQPATPLLTAPNLAAPSVDRFGWVWTASGGTVYAVQPNVVPVAVAAPWLVDREVHAVRVSRDGTRIAVVSAGADGVAIDVAGIARDDLGAPQQLSSDPAPRVGAALTAADQVVWIDDTVLVVLGNLGASSSVWEVPVGAHSETLPDVAGAVSLAGGRLERSLLVATGDGELLRYDGRTWVPVTHVEGVRDPSYPG
jgi:hypothetical protein